MVEASTSDAMPGSAPPRPLALALVERIGGVLVRPRATVRALHPDVGRHDGALVIALYLLGSQVYPFIEGLADVRAVTDWNAVVMFGSVLGRMFIAPILTMVLCETILGPRRSYRRGLAVVPLLVIGTVAHLLAQQGIRVPGGSYAPEIAGALASAALAWWIRPAVAEQEAA